VVAVEFPQRIGLSPHFSGDLFGGAFAKPEANKEKPEFRLTVGPNSGNLELKLTLTPDARKRVEEGLKKAKQGGPTLGGGP
jgi:hypothetical protein